MLLRRLFCTASVLVALMLIKSASAEEISAVLDLAPVTPTVNTFDIMVNVLSDSDTQAVEYTGVVRPVLDIDFSNPMAPVVNSIYFTGVAGDIAHSDATFTASLGTAAFENITGRIETPEANRPAPVIGGSFSASLHQLIAWQGTITVTPIIGSGTVIDLMESTFSGMLNGENNSMVAVTLDSVMGDMATYNVDVTALLEMVQLSTGKPEIDALVSVFVTGNLVATGQFTRPIPEPASALLAAGLAALALRRRRGA